MIVLPQLSMLFTIAVIGALLRRRGVMPDPVVRGISDIITMVTNPALVIMVAQHDAPDTLSGFLQVLWVGALIMAAIALAVYAAYRRQDNQKRPILALLAAFPNAGFMGLPLIQAVYGDLGALYLAAYIVAFNLVFWTIGMLLIDRRGFSLKKLFNPGFIAAALGMTLFLLRIDLPDLIDAPLNSLGSLNTPLAMLVLGARMADLKPRALIDRGSTLVALIRLVAAPLAALLISRALSMSPVSAGTLVLCSAMPCAIMGQLLAEQYDRDALLAARGISLTSLLSILTIPLIVTLLPV